MQDSEPLIEQYLKVADNIAQILASREVDVNELNKVVTYLQVYCQGKKKSGSRLLEYLELLIDQGEDIGHSNKTIGYYESIHYVCKKYLENYINSVSAMIEILSWVARLMRYYKKVGVPEKSNNQHKNQPASKAWERPSNNKANSQATERPKPSEPSKAWQRPPKKPSK